MGTEQQAYCAIHRAHVKVCEAGPVSIRHCKEWRDECQDQDVVPAQSHITEDST